MGIEGEWIKVFWFFFSKKNALSLRVFRHEVSVVLAEDAS